MGFFCLFVFLFFFLLLSVCMHMCVGVFVHMHVEAKGNLHFRSFPLFLSTLYFKRQGLSVNLGCSTWAILACW